MLQFCEIESKKWAHFCLTWFKLGKIALNYQNHFKYLNFVKHFHRNPIWGLNNLVFLFYLILQENVPLFLYNFPLRAILKKMDQHLYTKRVCTNFGVLFLIKMANLQEKSYLNLGIWFLVHLRIVTNILLSFTWYLEANGLPFLYLLLLNI